MDVPFALNDIGIRNGLQGYLRKSSMFCLQTDVVGLSALYKTLTPDMIDNPQPHNPNFQTIFDRKRGVV